MLPTVTGVLMLGGLMTALTTTVVFWPAATVSLLVILHSYLNSGALSEAGRVLQFSVISFTSLVGGYHGFVNSTVADFNEADDMVRCC